MQVMAHFMHLRHSSCLLARSQLTEDDRLLLLQAYVVHCTFQRHHTAGKRARLREAGLWLVDPPEYFSGEWFMTYQNDVAEYVDALAAKASSKMPPLFKHLHAMSYQLAAMRDALAMAQALNRTLVRRSCIIVLPFASFRNAAGCIG